MDRLFQLPKIIVDKQDSALNINENFLDIFSIGNKRLLSSMLWISTLLEADTQHYKGNDLNSWLFIRFNSISRLDPLFLENYTFGGQYLSIIKDDVLGGEHILKNGFKYYPNNYTLTFALAFLNVFEKGDYEQGLKFYELLEKFPQAPRNVKSLIHKLRYYQSGMNLEIAFDSVMMTYKSTKDPFLKNKLHADLYAIKAEMDLKCLNSNNSNCDQYDFDGVKYIKKGQQFVAPQSFKPYQLHK